MLPFYLFSDAVGALSNLQKSPPIISFAKPRVLLSRVALELGDASVENAFSVSSAVPPPQLSHKYQLINTTYPEFVILLSS